MGKAFDLINLIADGGSEGLGLRELAARTGVVASTVHRYVTSLIELGVVERDTDGTYHLGVRLVTLAGRYLEEHVVRAAAHPYLVKLADLSGETVHLAVPVGVQLVYLDKVEKAESALMVSRLGSQAPLHCTSLGKSLLSRATRTERTTFLEVGAERRTSKTLVGADLLAELDHVRQLGFALDNEENEEGVRCVGAPLMNADGDAVGAVSISAPTDRLRVEDCHRLAPSLIRYAAQISNRIGHAGTPLAPSGNTS